ncbi:MAG TPA: MarR family transcriptional regulator [Paracoccaceae bacterium]|nr:MarR family transcriptional regulator [Paracoccaceae bacterium]
MTAHDWELRLGFLIHDVSRLRRTLFDRWLAPLGITRSQWWVLAFLSRNDGMPQTELAIELDVGKVALGALIDRLEEGGFVKRKLDRNDRRVKRVVLTKQSLALIETLREKNSQFNQRILAGIPHDKIEATIEALRAMKHNLLDGAKEFALENNQGQSSKPEGEIVEAAARSSRGKSRKGRSTQSKEAREPRSENI